MRMDHYKIYILKLVPAMEHVAACAPVTQRVRVRLRVGESFLGEVFSGFFLTCKTNGRKLQAQKVPEYHLAVIIIFLIFALLECMGA